MTYFEQIGVNRQYGATNIHEAKRHLSKSCKVCSTKGKHIICERCAIANAYNDMTIILTK